MDKYRFIPEDFKKLNHWVLFGKNKVPLTVAGGYAKINDPDTWSSYKDAVNSASERGLGIGFVIGDSDFIAVDIDDYENNQEIAREFMESLNSYTEYSPSGNGIHIWVKGKINIDRYRRGNLEIYDKSTNRYLTFTGNVLGKYRSLNTTVCELQRLHSKYIDLQGENNFVPVASGIDVSDIVNIAKHSKNGEKFSRLYAGRWQGEYESQSEADLALCNMLAFYTRGDKSKMDATFRQSGLYRAKWDEKRKSSTYGALTIGMACEDYTNFYNPNDYHITVNQDGEDEGEEDFQGYIIEAPEGYFKQEGDGLKQISTFTIQLEEVIFNSRDDIDYKAIFKSESVALEQVFKAELFNLKSSFMGLLKHPSFGFTGSQNDIQEIKRIVSGQDYKTVIGLDKLGVVYKDGDLMFVSTQGVVDKNLVPIEGIVYNGDFTGCDSDILNSSPITAEELKTLGRVMFKFNELNITANIWCMLPLFMLKSRLRLENMKIPHLIIYGEAGAGKSETVERIIKPFFSMRENTSLNATGATFFALNKALASSETIPVIIDEYKPAMMSSGQLRLISDSLRNAYDGNKAIRGVKTQKLKEYTLTAPMILIGEEGQTETAIEERSVVLNFSKKGKRGCEESFNFLRNNSSLIRKFGYSILKQVMTVDIRDISKLASEIADEARKEIKNDRVITALTGLHIGLMMIMNVFIELGVSFREITGLSDEDMDKVFKSNLIQEVLDGGESTKSVVDKTLEIFDQMASLGVICEDYEYTIVNGTELALNTKMIYPKFTKFIKEYNLNDFYLKSKNQFTKQLRKTEYFMDYKPAKFGDSLNRAYVLDIDKLRETASIETMTKNYQGY